ncbi:MAG: hypothetical protein LBF02_01625 [Mycoplasmataceae bacterium]|jgi:hypothetical protein|nr:hypothetical protein [Mycoplasmataceae bacterium]
MVKLTQEQKKEINGGIGPMLLWTAITGTCLAASTLFNIVSKATHEIRDEFFVSPYDHCTSFSQNSEYYSHHSSSYSDSYHTTSLKISPRASSSSFFLPI